MRKLQKLAALGLAGSMALSLAACGGSAASSSEAAADSTPVSGEATAESTASGDEAVTLNWALWDKDSTAYWQALADGYMESHPNVTIEICRNRGTVECHYLGSTRWIWYNQRTRR